MEVCVQSFWKVLPDPYLSFFLTSGDLLRQWLLFLATTLQLGWLLHCSTLSLTIFSHSLELFPGTEKVNVIRAVAEQHFVVLWNGTGVADKITSDGRMGCWAIQRRATHVWVTVWFSDRHWCRQTVGFSLLCAWCLCCYGLRHWLWHRFNHRQRTGRHLWFDNLIYTGWSRRRSWRGGEVVKGWRRVRLAQQNSLCNSYHVCLLRLRHQSGCPWLGKRRWWRLHLRVTYAVGERRR